MCVGGMCVCVCVYVLFELYSRVFLRIDNPKKCVSVRLKSVFRRKTK